MQLMAVLAAGQQVEVRPLLDHIGGAPFAGDRDVVAQMPPEVVTEKLRPAIDFPAAEHLKALVIEQKDSAGSVALRHCRARSHRSHRVRNESYAAGCNRRAMRSLRPRSP